MKKRKATMKKKSMMKMKLKMRQDLRRKRMYGTTYGQTWQE
jgi:hypothetical protein